MMSKKNNLFHSMVLTCLLLLFTTSCYGFLDPFAEVKKLSSGKLTDVVFSADITESRQSLISNVKIELDNLKKEMFEQLERIDARSKVFESTLKDKVKTLDKKRFPNRAEALNRRAMVIKDAMQALIKQEEAWKLFKNRYEEYLGYLEATDESEILKKRFTPLTGTLKELNEVEEAVAQKQEELGVIYSSRKSLQNQERAEQDRLSALKQDLVLKKDAHVRVQSAFDTVVEIGESEEDSKNELGLKLDIARYEKELVEEKVAISSIKLKEFRVAAKLSDSRHTRATYSYKMLNSVLDEVKDNLRVEADDVRRAREAWQRKSKVAGKEKDLLGKQINELREKRTVLFAKLSAFRDELTSLQEKNVEYNEDQPDVKKSAERNAEIYVVRSKILDLEYQINVIDRTITLVERKVEVSEFAERRELLFFKALEIRYKLRGDEAAVSHLIDELEQWQSNLESEQLHTENYRLSAARFIEQRNLKSWEVKKLIEEIAAKKEDVFSRERFGSFARYKTAIDILESVRDAQEESKLNAEFLAVISELDSKEKYLLNQVKLLMREFRAKRREVNIWKRAPHAISIDHSFIAFRAAEKFFSRLFWDTPNYLLSPRAFWHAATSISLAWILGLFLYLIGFGFLFLVVRRLVRELGKHIAYMTSVQHGRTMLFYLLLTSSIIEFIGNYFGHIFTWFFLHLSISSNMTIWGFSFVVLPPYFKALFYLVSIPLFILYSKRLLESLGTLNQRLSYLFFNEASQSEAMRLIASALYSGSVLLPFRTAFLHYGPTGSQFASILLAAYTLILLVVVLLFFNKDDILSLLPRRGPIFGWLKQQIERFYYPTFFSFVGLLIIANPYIGYSNLAWFLAFAVPTSIFLIVGFFAVHHYVREYSLFIFIKEGDEGAEDRFDHAKMLYGFFVVLTFLMTVSMCFLVLSRIWGAPYTGPQLWEMISQEWVIPLKTGEKFGLVQFLIFFMFMMAGYLISSLFKKMLLGQLFEVFRIESGAQNTIARIAQYVIIMVFTTLGLAVVNLSAYVVYALGLLLLGVGLGIKDQLADIFAGILILLERHIEIGHYVNTDTAEGTVHSISLRSTVIRTARNFFIVIPNRSLIAKPIVNWGRGRVAVGMEIKVNVAYGTDIELIRSIMREVLYSHPLILRVPSVVVRLEEFEESGMQIFSRSYISARKVREMWAIASDVRTAILKMFKQHKIHIPFPQHVVHMVDDRYGVGGNLSIKFDENAASPQGVQEQK